MVWVVYTCIHTPSIQTTIDMYTYMHIHTPTYMHTCMYVCDDMWYVCVYIYTSYIAVYTYIDKMYIQMCEYTGRCQTYGSFLGPQYNRAPSMPKKEHNFDNHPYIDLCETKERNISPPNSQ